MNLSEISVRRPVFATVISLLLLIAGLISYSKLPVRQYPDIDSPVISIDTTYRGASADVVESKVTQIIEDRIAGIQGITKLTSSSRDERSSISVEFNINRDVDAAANDIRDRVARVLDDLPEEADPPEIAKVDSSTRPVMWLNLTSDRRSGLELTDYAERNLVDRLSVVRGVARVRISGARRYAMRIWLDRKALAARQLTVADVESTLRRENVELPAGRLESSQREFSLRTDTGLTTAQDFRELIIERGADGFMVRLGEVAEVRIGPENDRNAARANAIPAVSLGIEQLSKSNTVEVTRGIRDELVRIRESLPADIRIEVNYDRSLFISASMREVFKALAFSMSLVLIVIYLFLGNVRATLIPAVTIPVSIIASFIVMSMAGFSINVLTLLGLVLAIGLVVDDAIVVLENIFRRIERGEPVLLASLDGSRQISFAVIATTLVLIAVFLPISFIEGKVGRLFGEFGIALAAAVAFSSLVALTLTPMMCSKMFSGATLRTGITRRLDDFFKKLADKYQASVERVVHAPWKTIALAAAVSLLAYGLFKILPSEYAPREDRGAFYVMITAPEGASFDYTDRYARMMEAIILEEIATGDVLRVLIRVPARFGSTGDVNTARAILLLEDWKKRRRTAAEIAASVRAKLDELPGVRASVVLPQGLGVRGGNRPVQVVLGGSAYREIADWRDRLIATASSNPRLTNLESDYHERKPQIKVAIDRDRAGELGVSLSNIGRTLETMLGSRIVTTYLDRGRENNVILQGRDEHRALPTDLSNLHVRSERTGQLIPLNNLVTLSEHAAPSELNRFDRMRSITVTAGLTEDYSLGDALTYLDQIIRQELPTEARLSYDGESREFKRTGGSLYVTFGLALVVVFLVLAATFESFRHPLVIMGTVPLAVTGALTGLWLFGGTINIYSQIGVILLIGLAAKNGVLIVEFTNQLRDRGEEFHSALARAAAVRLRPVLMTSMCTTFGALPLLLATGAGAESRQPIGVVIVCGVAFSAALTLFVVPALYALIARSTRSPQYISRVIEHIRETQHSKGESTRRTESG